MEDSHCDSAVVRVWQLRAHEGRPVGVGSRVVDVVFGDATVLCNCDEEGDGI